jgi:hypothetical protein
MEAKRIRQVIFNSNQQIPLKYDVNQSIKIYDLKKMIEVALQIPRSNIKIFHNNVSYTEKDNLRLENLFPNLQTIEFFIVLEPKKEKNDDQDNQICLKIKLGDYCESHVYKYPCHFCFDCNKSFCSICNLENVHSGHETIEKYDYLQNPEEIVNRIFAKSEKEIKKINHTNLEQAKTLERYITDDLFKFLKEKIRQVEDRLKDMLNIYIDSHETSWFQMNENLKEVKKTCVDALEKRKEDLNISDMLIDENIIINYYNTIMQVHNQRQLFLYDKSKIEELEKSISKIKPLADTVFTELNNFLESKLNNEAFSQCVKEIIQNKVSPVHRTSFMNNLVKEIINSTNKKPSATKQLLERSCGKFMNSEKKKFHHLDNTIENENFNSNFDNNNNNNLNVSEAFKISSPQKERNNIFNNSLEANLQNYIASVAKQNQNQNQNFQNGTKERLYNEEISIEKDPKNTSGKLNK